MHGDAILVLFSTSNGARWCERDGIR
jgi:hypothetical protein